jgi:hypothetical protein
MKITSEKKDYYILLTGAKINFGDFLITNRAIKLLTDNIENFKYELLNNWENLDDKLDLINDSKGIIILGGPGYQTSMYPDVFPLVSDLNKLKARVSYLGGGAYAKSNDRITIEKYRFTEKAKSLLDYITKSGGVLSVRDSISQEVLKLNGYENAILTGCPVWYSNKHFLFPEEIKKVSFSSPQKKVYYRQFLRLLKEFKSNFPNIEIVVHFNRGIGVKPYTNSIDAKNTLKLDKLIRKMGINTLDISGSNLFAENLEDFDMHIGYRVHSHLLFVSSSLPSILLHEDSRGSGMTETLKSIGIDCFKITKFKKFLIYHLPYSFRKYLDKILPYRLNTKINKKIIDSFRDKNLLMNSVSEINKRIESAKIDMVKAINIISK